MGLRLGRCGSNPTDVARYLTLREMDDLTRFNSLYRRDGGLFHREEALMPGVACYALSGNAAVSEHFDMVNVDRSVEPRPSDPQAG